MNKCISIIIPVYKVEEYLNRCIESIVTQTYDNLQIIIVDDGSPDKCPMICDEWNSRDERIQVIHKENGGLSSARNAGLHIAKGEYVLFVDSDDCIAPDACEKLYTYAGGVDLVVAEATIYENGKSIHRVHTNLKENYIYSGAECAIEEIMAGEWFAAACYNFYKRDFLLDNNLFFVEGILHEDIDYLPKLFLAAKTVKYLHYEFYKYITRSTSICGTKSKKHFTDLIQTYSSWAKLNESIEDPKLKRAYAGALVKYFMATCRDYKVRENLYPAGMNGRYLIRNALNVKELIKAICFTLARPIYVNIKL